MHEVKFYMSKFQHYYMTLNQLHTSNLFLIYEVLYPEKILFYNSLFIWHKFLFDYLFLCATVFFFFIKKENKMNNPWFILILVDISVYLQYVQTKRLRLQRFQSSTIEYHHWKLLVKENYEVLITCQHTQQC